MLKELWDLLRVVAWLVLVWCIGVVWKLHHERYAQKRK